ncbi:MAG TPA: hypothetical protein H9678_07715, partial [Firmicutes bacterium]|nr:hypothetical protein [Bacillota bacterium]
MELYQEILRHILADEKIQVSFPKLTDSDSTKIVELECYRALRKIKAILEDGSLEDSECFYRIEEIVCVFEELGSDCGSRHDFRLSSYPNEKTGRCAKPVSSCLDLPLLPHPLERHHLAPVLLRRVGRLGFRFGGGCFHKATDFLRRAPLHLAGDVGIGVQGKPGAVMAQHAGQCLYIHTAGEGHGGKGVPLRYNYDKPEKPRRIKGFEVFSLIFSSFSKPKNHTEISR